MSQAAAKLLPDRRLAPLVLLLGWRIHPVLKYGADSGYEQQDWQGCACPEQNRHAPAWSLCFVNDQHYGLRLYAATCEVNSPLPGQTDPLPEQRLLFSHEATSD